MFNSYITVRDQAKVLLIGNIFTTPIFHSLLHYIVCKNSVKQPICHGNVTNVKISTSIYYPSDFMCTVREVMFLFYLYFKRCIFVQA